MSRKLQLEGKKFGRLKVLRQYGVDKSGKTIWECVCECGNHTFSLGSNLTSGKALSCGCLKNETISKRFKKHGMTKTRIYRIWQGMRRRCYDNKCKAYKNYGERGIVVCEEWKEGFQSFYDWAVNNGYSETLSIERKDVNGNYCPENCCWIPLSYQARNKTTTKRTKENKLALDIALNNSVIPSTMYGRLRNGMSVEESVSNKNFKRKKVQQIDIESGDVIATFSSVREAARSLDKSCSDISMCANGKLNKAYGYIWRFEHNE